MSNIDKQWLQQKIAGMEARRDDPWLGLDEDDTNTLAALRIAQASLEAEAVHQVLTDDAWVDLSKGAMESQKRVDAIARTLYTAQPATVSVPDRSMFEKWWESEHGSPLDSWDSLRTTDGYCDDGIDGQFEAWNACRAAMPQGADGTLTNEGTIPACTPCKLRDAVDAIRNSGIAIDGEKILAERDALNSPVIPDCWVMVPVEPTYQMCEAMGLPWESPRFPDRYKAMIEAINISKK
ncbi:hypothetical protein NEN81_02820 [Enterobacter asburiae]|uniref:hypothetical protein n=1 Tax=Enterobacter asburiae TaxID=61645 RepID=UPI002DB6E1A7|nr:hypothetical protein [Enterobacter asburiae]MEB7277284.1 hypothetical protein [Enterobacter asburiae]